MSITRLVCSITVPQFQPKNKVLLIHYTTVVRTAFILYCHVSGAVGYFIMCNYVSATIEKWCQRHSVIGSVRLSACVSVQTPYLKNQ